LKTVFTPFLLIAKEKRSIVKDILNKFRKSEIVRKSASALDSFFGGCLFCWFRRWPSVWLRVEDHAFEEGFDDLLFVIRERVTVITANSHKRLRKDAFRKKSNGNVLSQTIWVPTVGRASGFTAVQSYTYDSLNRLKQAMESITPNGGTAVQSWQQAFTFDR
jgi:hypothetical protein